MNSFRRCSSRAAGFTLIEVIAVLIIVGIIAAVAVSYYTSSQSELYTEADMLKSNLRFAQIRALNDDTATWGLRFTGSSYTLERGGTTAGIGFPSADNSSTHTLRSEVTLFAPARITYDVWGSPGTSDITITLSQGDSSVSLTINRNTGFVS